MGSQLCLQYNLWHVVIRSTNYQPPYHCCTILKVFLQVNHGSVNKLGWYTMCKCKLSVPFHKAACYKLIVIANNWQFMWFHFLLDAWVQHSDRLNHNVWHGTSMLAAYPSFPQLEKFLWRRPTICTWYQHYITGRIIELLVHQLTGWQLREWKASLPWLYDVNGGTRSCMKSKSL